MNYSDDVRQPLLGAGRAEKTDSLAPPSYTAFSAAGAGADVEDGPGEAFFSSPVGGGVPERAGFLSSLLPGRRGSHHHYYHHYYQPGAPAQPCRRRHRRSCCRSLCMHLCWFTLLGLVALYVLGVSLGLLGSGFRFWHPTLRPHGPDNNNGNNNDALPPLAPGAPDAPVHTLPSHPAPPAHATLPPPSPSAPLAGALFMPGRQCRAHNGGQTVAVIPTTTYDVVFGADARLAVEQNVTHVHAPGEPGLGQPDGRRVPVQVYGDVVIRAGARAGVEIEALANDDRIHAAAAFDAARQTLAVTVDDGVWAAADAADPWPCLVVRATVWVPPAGAGDAASAAALRALDVSAVHLGVVVADDVALAVRDAIRLASVVGDVDGHYDVAADAPSTRSDYVFDAPSVALASTSGHIHGLWSRRNRLVASTVSGDIAVAVRALPRVEHPDNDDDKDHQGLGTVVLDSTSGSIDLREAAAGAADAPPHRLVVSTKSGAITGAAAFARYAGLHSVSGAITPRLTVARWPAAPADPAESAHAFLGTDTVSGATDLTVAAADAGPLDFLRANHRSVSGAVTLHYPPAWAGRIELVSRFGGSVAVHGDHVVELPTGPHGSPVGHRLVAVKDLAAGAPASNITAATVSGAVDLSF